MQFGAGWRRQPDPDVALRFLDGHRVALNPDYS
jgi:hypothetical protein